MARLKTVSRNLGAFLDTIAWSEIGPKLLAASDDGYNVCVGGSLFEGYADHPRKLITLPGGLQSTAAGRYQLLSRYWDAYRTRLHLTDFSPESQDLIAIQQIRECRALDEIEAGRALIGIAKCARIWASLPGAGYGQHENRTVDLLAAYKRAGGELS